MFVSVIIPTFNRTPILLDLLKLLNEQTYPSKQFEVVVCSDGSTDNIYKIITRVRLNYKLIYVDTGQTKKYTPAAARNLGIENSRGDLLIFLDDDRYPVPEFISEHVRSHQAAYPNSVIVYGPRIGFEVPYGCRECILPLQELTIDHWAVLKSYKVVPWELAKTSNLSVTRATIIKYGKFNERFQQYGFEDTEFVYRLTQNGISVIYNENAINRHVQTIKVEEVERKLTEMIHTEQIMREIHPGFQRIRVEQEILNLALA